MTTPTNHLKRFAQKAIPLSIVSTLGTFSFFAEAAPTLEKEVLVTERAMYFNGVKKASTQAAENDPDVGPGQFDYVYGKSLSPHGDCIKTYKEYVFMTWYRGGKYDRKLMLTRYNTNTGTSATIEFPHRHTGYSNRWWVGETHNTIGLGLSPKDETIHMVFDQHSLSSTNPVDGSSKNDYFRYYYSKPNALTVPDSEFTLDLFVKDDYFAGNDPINPYHNPNNETDEYKHITLTGEVNSSKYQALTYPKFSLTDEGDLYLLLRKGRSKNGAFVYNKYDGSKWFSSFKMFNYTQAKSRGNAYDYGVYGEMKYAGGKVGIGFQQRANVTNDRYIYQNGFFGAYTDGSGWKNYDDQTVSTPIVSTDPVKISEPGDLVTGNEVDRFSMVGGFDWNVTDRGDVHFIGKVVDTQLKKATYVHTYRKAGETEFTSTSDFSGGEALYTAGNNIYLVGLKNGRPFVDKTEGGTNNFERIYQQTDGRTYEKGVVHISDGKLYYYLLENHDGSNPDARTAYLQIIDLDLDGAPQEPVVEFPQSSMTVEEGYEQLSFKVQASSPVAGRTISQVDLYADGNFIRTDSADPFVWGHSGKPTELLGLSAGTHTFKAVATDSEGVTGEATMTLEVVATTPVVSFPQSSRTVDEGYEQLSFVVNATSPVEGRTISQVDLYVDGNFIRTDSADPFVWGHSGKPTELLGLSAGTHTFTAVATDSEGVTGEAEMTLTVVGTLATTVSFAQEDMQLTEGYQNLSVTADVTTPDGVEVVSVGLYINDVLVREELVAPYTWGQGAFTHELLGLSAGNHTFKAVVLDSDNNTSETTMSVAVLAAAGESCTATQSIGWDTHTEVDTASGNCMNFDSDLSGQTLQAWDSDENTSCDFRGEIISTTDPAVSVEVTSNYHSFTGLTGTTFKLVPNNGCPYIKVRAY